MVAGPAHSRKAKGKAKPSDSTIKSLRMKGKTKTVVLDAKTNALKMRKVDSVKKMARARCPPPTQKLSTISCRG